MSQVKREVGGLVKLDEQPFRDEHNIRLLNTKLETMLKFFVWSTLQKAYAHVIQRI
jgi:hypothetical protein